MSPHRDLEEIRTLITQAESLVSQLESLIPSKSDWLHWRRRGIHKRLEAARANLKGLVDHIQIRLLEDATSLRGELAFSVTRQHPHKVVAFASSKHDVVPFEGRALREVFDPAATHLYEMAFRSVTPKFAELITHTHRVGAQKMRWQAKIEAQGDDIFIISVRYTMVEGKVVGATSRLR